MSAAPGEPALPIAAASPAGAPPASPGPAPPGKPARSVLRAHLWQTLTAFALVLVVGIFTLRWWLGPHVVTETVLRRSFVQTVVATGRVEAPHRVEVGAQITGAVLRIPVREGQSVREGELLVELESGELMATGRQADVAVAQAQARLRQVREVQGPVAAQTLRQARAGLKNANADLARSRDLFGRGFIGKAALDDAREAVELADAKVRAAQTQFDTTRSAGSDRALAVANVASAEASAEAASARTGYATIRAPVTGTLISRNVEEGDVVQPGKVLMTLSPTGRAQLVVAIDEKNLSLLALHQSALASADAYPSERFAAELVYINPGVNASTGAVEVKLDVVAPPALLRQDMTVSVDIEVARRAEALVVPMAAVHDADSAPWVLRLEGHRAIRRPVTLGLRGAGVAEVLAGLAEGDAVLAEAVSVKSGARVRTSAPVAIHATSALK